MNTPAFARRTVTTTAGIVALTLVTACAALPGQTPPPTIPSIPAATVTRGDVQSTLSLSGGVQARDQITVLPKASGRVEQVLVDVGTPVHAGDTLAQLESDSPQIAVAQAQANLAAAQAKAVEVKIRVA